MKKLFAVLMALCLLCAAAAALAETETEELPQVITFDEGVELTEADFEGEWVVSRVYKGETLMTDEEVAQNFHIAPITIADKKVTITYDEGNTEEYVCYVEANQLALEDENAKVVFDKLNDGNLVMSMFIEGEDGETICVSFILVHPEA